MQFAPCANAARRQRYTALNVSGTASVVVRPSLRTLGNVAALAAVYVLVAKLGLMLNAVSQFATVVWAPTGISLAALLLLGYEMAVGVFVGAFVVNFWTGAPVTVALGLAVGNTLEAFLGAYAMRRFAGFQRSIESLRHVLVLIVPVALMSTLVSATIGVTSLALAGLVSGRAFWQTWRVWWIGDVLGDLVVAPLLLTHSPRRGPALGALDRKGKRIVEAFALAIFLVGASFAVFFKESNSVEHPFESPYLLFPLFIWAAVRFTLPGATLVTAIASAFAIWGTVRGLGPFARETLSDGLLDLQIFMGCAALTPLVVAGAISDRTRLEVEAAEIAARHEREDQFRKLVESAPDAIVIASSTGEIMLVNAQAESLFGYDRKELIGQNVDALIPERHREKHAEHRAGYAKNPKARPMGVGLELYGLRKDGREFPVEISLSPIESDGGLLVFTAIRDISDRKVAEQELNRLAREQAIRAAAEELSKKAERRFRILSQASRDLVEANLELSAVPEKIAQRIVEAIGDSCAVRLLTEDGDHLKLVSLHHANPEALGYLRELFGKEPERVEDTPGGLVVRTGEPFILTVGAQDVFRKAAPARLLPYLDRFGVYSLLTVPLRSRGTIIGSITVTRTSPGHPYTVEDQGLLEELSDRAGLAMYNARLHEDLKTAVQVRDDFLAIAGHELKTPLAAMMMQIQGIQRALQRDPARLAERAARAGRSALRLERLVNQLLDVSRITAGRLHLEPEPLNLSDLVKEVVNRFTEATTQPSAPISVHCDDQVNGRWDRLRVDQVVNNLVGNAVKYGQGKPVEVDLHGVDGQAVLRVVDHGIGIDAEHQQRIFQRFERAVAARDFGGLGLGLWISRQIVEASGGTIEVESTPGRGSTFTVRLPVNREGFASEGHHAE